MDEKNQIPNPPETPEMPETPAAPSKPEGGVDVHALAEELASIMAAKEPTPEELAAEEARQRQEATQAARLKRRKRRRRNFRDLLLRIVLLGVIVYVLFFHLVGVLKMPNDDMYPRIDSGDLVLFYRLEKDVRAQDVIVLQKDASALQEYVDTNEIVSIDDGDEDEFIDEPISTPGPTAVPVSSAPNVAPSAIVTDSSLLGKINRLWYTVQEKLGLRLPTGKQYFVCRVVATAGDTVEITDEGRLIVNGNSMIESNIFYPTTQYLGFTEYPLTLHAGECFVLADKRNGGADSRFFGVVREDEILGTVFTIVRRNNL